MGQIPNTQRQDELVLREATAIPGGATELGQPTGPQATDLEGVLRPTSQFSAACGP